MVETLVGDEDVSHRPILRRHRLKVGGRFRFFFSGRSRHTRWPRDWSSDVCSSDLQASQLEVGVEIIGTPAEERGGGKIDLLRKGVFDKCVAVLSSHPASGEWAVSGTGLGAVGKRVTFTGLASHAGAAPEKGRNALNAVIRLFVGVDGWRQQLEGDSRVHGVITDGGKAMNVVPARAEAIFGLRAKERATLDGMVERFRDIAEGAALLTGTTVEVPED